MLAKKRAYWHVTFGAILASFVGYGVGQFTTSFLIRTHGLAIEDASLLFGLTLGLMAAIGAFLSGWLADTTPRLWWGIPALGQFVSMPLYAFGYIESNLWLAMPTLMMAATLHHPYLGPMYAVAGGVLQRGRSGNGDRGMQAANLYGARGKGSFGHSSA